jgi:putative addiction module CopG family antidote
MKTINISLPDKLKSQAQELVDRGFYASFSDLVRDALRRTVEKDKYDLMYEQAVEDVKNGDAVVMKTEKDIEDFVNSL